uniref:histidine kinase n=1 Tax=Chromera velia CCMP2878 TaxID=1169474 RepID=A0A0G4GJA1_9ALVE|eukprot:Cvel_22143.t1-p1 / transcript=Cvel_22143.t1 / gene=Cvel_22143 / organism=Chromera_velia_CCMP2878 / gene_product=Autoinducer 2 sensor kinase/phosphatase LuxQ, putative / transcript_product=Autoinducer 2 sensor kinase/phosphatase LuxQ, putative / location=Cvel_scaffold2147:32167-33384(-) / protein_length=406 / sequence_SO=supercontig / SO=protein_coding / is_pseudo=false
MMKWVVMRVSVTDTGPGLSKEDMTKLFKPYGQVRAGELQNGGGTGLGLVICKSFVEAHAGGQIGVESHGRGEGSTFFFEVFMPLVALNEGPSGPHGPTQRLGGKFVVKSQQSSTQSPTKISISVLQEENDHQNPEAGAEREEEGEEEGEKEKEEEKERKESISESPGSSHASPLKTATESDVLAVGERRAENVVWSSEGVRHGEKVHDCRIPMTKSNGEMEVEVEGKTKKLSPSLNQNGSLVSLSSCTGRADSPSSPFTPSLNTAQGLTAVVLLVDDDRFCLMAGSAAIKRLGFSVRTAEDGHEAVRVIVEGGLVFRLVLMDKNMARMNGPEAMKRLRGHFMETVKKGGQVKNIPSPLLIGYTGDAVQESSQAFLDAGADKVIIKPLQVKDLAALLGFAESSQKQL